MQKFIVIGNPITHSKSPIIHQEFARQLGINIDYQKQLCPADAESFSHLVDAFFNKGGVGANVTLPFKEMAYTLCRQVGELSEHAQHAKAVNTLAFINGKLYGDNTDGRGLVADLTHQGISLEGQRIALLGAGGAARGVILPLLNAGASVEIFNRSPQKAVQMVADFLPFLNTKEQLCAHPLEALQGHYAIIINSTSAITQGQSLGLGRFAVNADIAYDMSYGKDSEFLRHFATLGADTYDGIGMLIHQALLSFCLWHKIAVEAIDIKRVYEAIGISSQP